ncbi:MAG TPA: tRNA (N6-isopentenyl adenosine(37)-C2)-methylthiotransferase MiaB [Elusimicrobiales bacterium]|nr:tRNA (N6-isopentenyl adenosine(37)-C2)-methylthiotransferase MiaB [Elusimicrobiales bacterium]
MQTFGCQMNLADSRFFLKEFAKYGFAPTETISKADAVLVNTCTVREHAEHRALSYIGRLLKWKNAGDNRLLAVTGCAAQRMGDKLRQKFPHIDIVLGAKEIDKFPSILAKAMCEKNLSDYCASKCLQKSQVSEFITIMRGCSHKCSYCIVPSVRGKSVFYPSEKILEDVKRSCRNGAKEIILLGQTVNSYRSKGVNFSALIRLIHKIPQVKRIRYMSPHPAYVNEEFIKTLDDCPKVARSIHLPIQSGSDKILKLVKRGYTRKKIITLVEKLKARDISVSTDLMVGFPTETNADFNETLNLVKECGFSNAYCFKYSPRANTELAKHKRRITQLVIERRLKKLLETVKKTSSEQFLKQIGTVQQVLMESDNRGRTSSNYRVKIDSKKVNKNHRPGSILKVKIRGRFKHTLIGDAL